MNYLFFRKALFCIFSLFIPCSVVCKEIPSVIHWIHPDSSPISKEEIQSIKSWQKLHPDWRFKLWSNAPCSLPNLNLCKIENSEDLQKTILQKEGGVLIDLQLVGCKTLNGIALAGQPFQTADARSMIGCAPNQYDSPRKILPDSFMLPDQTFTIEVPSAPLSGVCFSRFKILPGLTEELRKIHAAPYEARLQAKALSKKISKTKQFIIAIFLLSLSNAFVLIVFFPLLKASFIHKKKVIALFICALLIFSLKPLRPSSKSKQKIDPKSFYSLFHFDAYPKRLSPSDQKNLEHYNNFFSRHFLSAPSTIPDKKKIPHVIHLIWGGVPFPETSTANLASWMKHHPDWTFMFWTDDPNRPIPMEGMKKRLFEEILSQSWIRPYFEQSRNWGEKSDLLRYEILLREGGLYIDHDIECLHPFTSLHDHATFYASAEPLHQSPIYDSHLTLSNCLIGAEPNHPILSSALALCVEKWDLASQIFPQQDQRSTLLRTLYRTFSSFDEAVRSHLSNETESVILPPSLVFLHHFAPALYTSLKSTDYPLANHQWANSWFEQIPSIHPLDTTQPIATKISLLSKFCKRIAYFLTSTLLFLITLLLYKVYVQDNLNFLLRSPLVCCRTLLKKFKWRRISLP